MSLIEDLENAADTMESVERAGISMKTVTAALLDEACVSSWTRSRSS